MSGKASDLYKVQRALGRRAKEFYKVECPFCGAGINRGCFQKSIFAARGEKKYFPPHSQRVALVLKNERETNERNGTDNGPSVTGVIQTDTIEGEMND